MNGAKELLKYLIQIVDPEVLVFDTFNDKDKLEFKNKVNFYRAQVAKTKQRIEIKREKITAINMMLAGGQFKNELGRLDLEEQILEEEQAIMKMEIDIAAKDFYQSQFVKQVKYHEEVQEKIGKEADLNFLPLVKQAEQKAKALEDSKKKMLLYGLISQAYAGFQTPYERNTVYQQLKDAMSKL